MIGLAVKKKSLQAAAPARKGNVCEQPGYETRSRTLPLINEEERHPLYLDRDHDGIVMATITPRTDRMESVFHRPGGYHIGVHQGPALGEADVVLSTVQWCKSLLHPYR